MVDRGRLLHLLRHNSLMHHDSLIQHAWAIKFRYVYRLQDSLVRRRCLGVLHSGWPLRSHLLLLKYHHLLLLTLLIRMYLGSLVMDDCLIIWVWEIDQVIRVCNGHCNCKRGSLPLFRLMILMADLVMEVMLGGKSGSFGGLFTRSILLFMLPNLDDIWQSFDLMVLILWLTQQSLVHTEVVTWEIRPEFERKLSRWWCKQVSSQMDLLMLRLFVLRPVSCPIEMIFHLLMDKFTAVWLVVIVARWYIVHGLIGEHGTGQDGRLPLMKVMIGTTFSAIF